MKLDSVRIAALASALPSEGVSSDALEERIRPLYDRLRLHVGRLELMSGIRERRFWPAGTRPSAVATRAGESALEMCGIDRSRIGVLIFASVCRDFLEPASASVVHAALDLPPTCQAFDLSNACLGFANAMTLVGGMIERGEVEAGIVVAGEDGGPLVEQTLQMLSEDPTVGRDELKRAYASLTIGAGAAACVLDRDGPHKLLGATARAATEHHVLCAGDKSEGNAGPLMDTDSEALLQAGNALAKTTWDAFVDEHGWDRDGIDRIVTHQVGTAHKRLLFETLELDHAKDFTTVEFLGNMGSVSLPVTLAMAAEQGFVAPGHKIVLQGIGSGLHCLMLAVEW